MSTTAWSSRLSRNSLRNAGRKQRAMSSAVILPPLPWPSRIRSECESGNGQLSDRPALTSDDIRLTEYDVNQVPDDMIESDVRLLDPVDAERRNDEGVIGERREAPAILSCEGNSHQTELSCHLERMHEVRRLTARTQRQRHIAAPGMSPQLIAEDLREVTVVRDGGEEGIVGRQRDGRQRSALLDNGVAELHRDVLGVGGAPAVAHDVEPASALECRRHRACERFDAIGFCAEERLFHLGALARLSQDRVLHGAVVASRCRPYA